MGWLLIDELWLRTNEDWSVQLRMRSSQHHKRIPRLHVLLLLQEHLLQWLAGTESSRSECSFRSIVHSRRDKAHKRTLKKCQTAG